MSLFNVYPVAVQVSIAAPIERVWEALTQEATEWWPKEFYIVSKSQAFVIEPKIGGQMYEDAGNGEGLIWAHVLGVDSPTKILLRGYLSPDFGGPAQTFLRLSLEEEGNGKTSFVLKETVYGAVQVDQDSSLTEGWKTILGALKGYLE